jgi:hypothetical protein
VIPQVTPADIDEEPSSWLGPQTRVTLVELSVTENGDELIVGNVAQGKFVSVPPVAVVIINSIRSGDSLGDTATLASRVAGADVDVIDFVTTLLDLGFVTQIDGVPVGAGRPPSIAHRPASERLARRAIWLFSRPAWILYAALFVACSGVLIAEPAYRPHATQLFFLHSPLVSVALLTIVSAIIAALHELAHWLAARVEHLPARVSISRRLYVLVLQTDLTAIWSLPRRRRIGPLLAGIAFHTVLLSLLLIARTAADADLWQPPVVIAKLIAALVVVTITGLAFQFFIFLRTDLYGVFVTLLGCVNLTRVNRLLIKRTLVGLTPNEQQELADAHRRDVRVARYYCWLYLAGLAFAGWYFVVFVLPWVRVVVAWVVAGVTSSGPGDLRRWTTPVLAIIVLIPLVLPVLMAARTQYHRLNARGRDVNIERKEVS